MTRPKNPRDQWNELVALGASAGLDEVADMSEAEVDAELRKAGVDVEEENRVGQAEHEAALRARSRPEGKPRRRGLRLAAWVGAATAALVAAGEALYVLGGPGPALVGSGQVIDAGADAEGGQQSR